MGLGGVGGQQWEQWIGREQHVRQTRSVSLQHRTGFLQGFYSTTRLELLNGWDEIKVKRSKRNPLLLLLTPSSPSPPNKNTQYLCWISVNIFKLCL